MSKAHPSTAKPPPAHLKMLEACIAKGWIKRVGDSFEITPEGHAYTMRTIVDLREKAAAYEGGDWKLEGVEGVERWNY